MNSFYSTSLQEATLLKRLSNGCCQLSNHRFRAAPTITL